MRIVLFGEDSFTAIVLESLINDKHDILQVFCPKYGNNIHKRLELVCKSHNVNFEIINDFKSQEFVDKVNNLSPDIIAICHFQKLISEEIIKIPKFGCLNLHPSLLPEYRGMAPQHWPIIKGDNKTAVTVHFVDNGIDTGDIVLQREVEILDNDYVSDLQGKMREIYSSIFAEAIRLVNNGNGNYLVQRHLLGSFYGRLRVADCVIDKDMGVKDAYNLIRGVSFPYFGARFEDYIFWRAQIKDYESNLEIKFEIDNKLGFLRLKDGCILINKFEKI